MSFLKNFVNSKKTLPCILGLVLCEESFRDVRPTHCETVDTGESASDFVICELNDDVGKLKKSHPSTIKNNLPKYSLQSANVFFRHGARTPLHHLPGVEEVTYDKTTLLQEVPETIIPIEVKTISGSARPRSKLEERYETVQFKGGMHAGMLTSTGRRQAYSLGQRLRKRYMCQQKFLQDKFDTSEVYIRSTNVNRCIDSLQCALCGLFGQESFTDPVIISVVPLQAEILFPNFRYCDTLKQLEHKTPSYLAEQNGMKFVSHYIKYFTKNKDDNLVNMMAWRDHDVARKTHGLEVPLWLEAIREHVDHWATKSLETYMCGVPQDKVLVLQLVAGPMLNLVAENFEAKIKDCRSTRKLSLYSCHDSSLIPLMKSLGIFNNKWPPFCASVHIDLYTDDNDQYFVKIAYCDEDITLPGFESPMIPYCKFKELIKPYRVTPSQYQQRCNDHDLAKEHAKKWESIIQAHVQEEECTQMEFPPNM